MFAASHRHKDVRTPDYVRTARCQVRASKFQLTGFHSLTAGCVSSKLQRVWTVARDLAISQGHLPLNGAVATSLPLSMRRTDLVLCVVARASVTQCEFRFAESLQFYSTPVLPPEVSTAMHLLHAVCTVPR